MRLLDEFQTRLLQPFFGNHPHARELETISEILDGEPDMARLAHEDLTRGRDDARGRRGLSGDQVVRIGLLKMMHCLSYRELAFFLQDSTAFRAFARLRSARTLEWTTLQSNLTRITEKTWEQINRLLLSVAKEKGIESGKKIRTDCTAIESNIHAPTDSSLLWDCVRVVTRLMGRAQNTFPNAEISFTDHTRRAKRRAHAIAFPPKGKKRAGHLLEKYRDLLKVTEKTYRHGQSALAKLETIETPDIVKTLLADALAKELKGHLESMARVIDQTQRRVLRGEQVPSGEKLLSIFETHTDIIVKAEREVVFGHKICLSAGASSLILDCSVEDGNPADATLVRRTIERQIEIYGKAPRQVSFDGGFASKENLRIAKQDLGVQDAAFHKKCGLEVAEMVKSPWVYKRLRHFRAGIEGLIGTLKNAFGLTRCLWRSLAGFKRCVWASVVGFNFLTLARHLRR